MLMPRIFGENLFDSFFDFPQMPGFDNFGQIDKKLYGHNAQNIMKADVKENDNEYEMLIDLPGFAKEEISAQLVNGYLTITATKGLDHDEQDKETGRYIRRERYAGSCQRSFYVGEGIKQEDIKAAYHHGILKLTIPKNIPQITQSPNNYIAIEG